MFLDQDERTMVEDVETVSSPWHGAWWCARSLRGEACWPCAQPGDESRTASQWQSTLQMTPRHQKTRAEGRRGVSKKGRKVNQIKTKSRFYFCRVVSVCDMCVVRQWLYKAQPLKRHCCTQMTSAPNRTGWSQHLLSYTAAAEAEGQNEGLR